MKQTARNRIAEQFLHLALRRAARGTGSSLDLYDRRTAVQPLPNLNSMLKSLPWALVGGIALRAYMPERMTLDVDILIHERDAENARISFLAANYTLAGQLSIGGFTVRPATAGAPDIDVLTRNDPWLDNALAHPTLDLAGYPVLGRPYLTLMKLQAGRTQDLADVQRLLARTPLDERATTRVLVLHESPELVEDYDSLCTLADLEFGAPPE